MTKKGEKQTKNIEKPEALPEKMTANHRKKTNGNEKHRLFKVLDILLVEVDHGTALMINASNSFLVVMHKTISLEEWNLNSR